MAVPTTIDNLSVTASSNSPAGSDSVTTSTGPDEYFRALSAIVRRGQGSSALASAGSLNIGGVVTGDVITISGTTTITSLGTIDSGIERTLIFSGALTLTHNSTSLILPTGANILTVSGDSFTFRSLGSGNWRCTGRSASTPLTGAITTVASGVASLGIGSGGTGQTSALIPSGTKMLFVQGSAPVGWTQVTSDNDKALRVVSGTGGGTGGSVAFETAFASQTVAGTNGGTAITIAQMPAHTHNFTASVGEIGGGGGGALQAYNPVATTSTGGGATHTHTFTGTAINLDVAYINTIICSKD